MPMVSRWWRPASRQAKRGPRIRVLPESRSTTPRFSSLMSIRYTALLIPCAAAKADSAIAMQFVLTGLEQREADLKEFFDIVDFLLVDDEQDDMVLCLDHGVVVRDDDIVAAYDRADRGAGRQFDLL